MPRKIIVFDTTLRDGEQSPGASLSLTEKITIAHQLAKLKVDVIEAGFPISSPEDFEAVKRVAEEVEGPEIAGLCRAVEKDIDAAWGALQHAKKPRIHTFIGTSNLHIESKFQSTKPEILKRAVHGVEYAKQACPNVEFSAEDAMRTDLDYLRDVVESVIEAGATTVNIPDTVGYTTPWEIHETIKYLFENVPNISQAVISVHNHDDLGMSVANSLAAIMAGAGQVECTINGMGERAGNAALEEIVMAIKTRADILDCETGIVTRELMKTSRMVSNLTGFIVQRNKAIVGENAFAHEAGIHQHGVIMNRQTYEIMQPEDVGVSESALTLGRRSGKHGLRKRLEDLGYEVTDEQMGDIYERFVRIADTKKQVYDEDLEMIMREATDTMPAVWNLVSLQTTSGPQTMPTATVKLEREGEMFQDAACGNGPVDASCKAIERITGVELTLEDYSLRSVSMGKDALGEATVKVKRNGHEAIGKAASTDVVEASAKAYLNAVNRLLVMEERAERLEGV
ncbi:MAG: 2-isopropylmalate synthase [Acidobacteriota bacterium]|nr:2-isopropylmalate synthase [Acidobacteriota bacterium]